MKINYVFSGFTKKSVQFLKDLALNNNKEWFDEHREIYETELRDKMKELCIALTPQMLSIDESFEVRPHRCISRINRDIRFSKDKTPYKTNLWLAYSLPLSSQEWQNYPGFFFEFTADYCMYGMGIYQPKRYVMDDIRDHITYAAVEFKQETEKLLRNGFEIYGEEYKRKLENNLDDYYQPWYHRKGLALIKKIPHDNKIYSEKIKEQIEADFCSLEWFYNFLKQSQPE